MDEHAKETAEKSGLTGHLTQVIPKSRPGLITLKVALGELQRDYQETPCQVTLAAIHYVESAISVLEDNPPVKDNDGS